LGYCVPFDESYKAAFEAQTGSSFNGTMAGVPDNFLTQLVKDFLTSRAIVLGFGLGVAAVRRVLRAGQRPLTPVTPTSMQPAG
jgi:hypothetical protein